MKTEQSIPWWRGFRTLLTMLVVLGLLLQSTPPSVATAISGSTPKLRVMSPEYSGPDTVTAIRYCTENDVGASKRNWSSNLAYYTAVQEIFEYTGSRHDEISHAAIPEVLSEPIQVLDSDNNYFLKIDLRDSRVHPRVLLANNDTGGLQTLSGMKSRIQGYSQWAIVNADLFSGNCPAGQNCAQGLTYIL